MWNQKTSMQIMLEMLRKDLIHPIMRSVAVDEA